MDTAKLEHLFETKSKEISVTKVKSFFVLLSLNVSLWVLYVTPLNYLHLSNSATSILLLHQAPTAIFSWQTSNSTRINVLSNLATINDLL